MIINNFKDFTSDYLGAQYILLILAYLVPIV